MDFAIENAILLPAVAFFFVTGILLATFTLTGSYDQLIEARIRKLGDSPAPAIKPNRPLWAIVIAKLAQAIGRLFPTSEKANRRLQTQFVEAGVNAPGAASAYTAAKCMLALVLPLGVFAH